MNNATYQDEISFEEAASMLDASEEAFANAMKGRVWTKTEFADGTRPAYIEMLCVCDSSDNPLEGAVMQFLCKEAEAGNPQAVELRNEMIANHRYLMAHHIADKHKMDAEQLNAAKKTVKKAA